MTPDLSDIISSPWGLAGLLLLLLAPRLILRLRDPRGVRVLGKAKLLKGYVGATALAVLVAAAAAPLDLRAWPEATPVRGAVELMASSSTAKYVLSALLAWATAAFLVAPVVAWLATYSLANGLLTIAVCLPFGALLGFGAWLAWHEPWRTVAFNVASALVLVAAAAIGFSVGARVPLTVRWRSESAA